jgi:glycine cleavage system aminomethyltransferase T
VSSSENPFAFLSPAATTGAVLRTPMERNHRAAGATLQEQDGWRIAEYETADDDLQAWTADLSHTGKLDVRGTAQRIDELTGGLELGRGNETGGVWTLRLSPTHAIVICPFDRVVELAERIGDGVVDMTCGWAAVMLGGPAAREVFMRSSSLDVREHRFPPGACMAGSVMRCPSIVLNDDGRLWVLCGWEFGEYMWEALLDAGVHHGIAPVSASVALPATVVAR